MVGKKQEEQNTNEWTYSFPNFTLKYQKANQG